MPFCLRLLYPYIDSFPRFSTFDCPFVFVFCTPIVTFFHFWLPLCLRLLYPYIDSFPGFSTFDCPFVFVFCTPILTVSLVFVFCTTFDCPSTFLPFCLRLLYPYSDSFPRFSTFDCPFVFVFCTPILTVSLVFPLLIALLSSSSVPLYWQFPSFFHFWLPFCLRLLYPYIDSFPRFSTFNCPFVFVFCTPILTVSLVFPLLIALLSSSSVPLYWHVFPLLIAPLSSSSVPLYWQFPSFFHFWLPLCLRLLYPYIDSFPRFSTFDCPFVFVFCTPIVTVSLVFPLLIAPLSSSSVPLYWQFLSFFHFWLPFCLRLLFPYIDSFPGFSTFDCPFVFVFCTPILTVSLVFPLLIAPLSSSSVPLYWQFPSFFHFWLPFCLRLLYPYIDSFPRFSTFDCPLSSSSVPLYWQFPSFFHFWLPLCLRLLYPYIDSFPRFSTFDCPFVFVFCTPIVTVSLVFPLLIALLSSSSVPLYWQFPCFSTFDCPFVFVFCTPILTVSLVFPLLIALLSSSSVPLYWQFPWFFHFWLPLCLRLLYPYIDSFPRFSTFDCPFVFVFCTPILTVSLVFPLLIALLSSSSVPLYWQFPSFFHFWLPFCLRLLYPYIDSFPRFSTFDCPFVFVFCTPIVTVSLVFPLLIAPLSSSSVPLYWQFPSFFHFWLPFCLRLLYPYIDSFPRFSTFDCPFVFVFCTPILTVSLVFPLLIAPLSSSSVPLYWQFPWFFHFWLPLCLRLLYPYIDSFPRFSTFDCPFVFVFCTPILTVSLVFPLLIAPLSSSSVPLYWQFPSFFHFWLPLCLRLLFPYSDSFPGFSTFNCPFVFVFCTPILTVSLVFPLLYPYIDSFPRFSTFDCPFVFVFCPWLPLCLRLLYPYSDSFPRFSTFDCPFVFVFCTPILTVSLVFPLLIAPLCSYPYIDSFPSVPLYWQFPSFFHFWLPFCLRLLYPYSDSFPRFSTFDCPFVFVFCTPILTVSLVFPLLSSSSVPLYWQFPWFFHFWLPLCLRLLYPYIDSFSRFSTFDCPFVFVFCTPILTVSLVFPLLIAPLSSSSVPLYWQFPWFFHFWLPFCLRLLYPYIDSFPGFSTFDYPFVFVFCTPILTVSLVFPLLIALLSSSSVPLYWQFPWFFHFWLSLCLRLLYPYIDSFPGFSTFDCPFVFVFCTPILTVSLVFPLLIALLSSSSVPLYWQFPWFFTFDCPFVFVFCTPILTVSLVFPLLIALLSSSSVPLYWQFPSFFHFWLPFCLRLLYPYIDSFPGFSTFDCPFVFVFCTPILTVSLVFPLLIAPLSSSSVPLYWQFPWFFHFWLPLCLHLLYPYIDSFPGFSTFDCPFVFVFCTPILTVSLVFPLLIALLSSSSVPLYWQFPSFFHFWLPFCLRLLCPYIDSFPGFSTFDCLFVFIFCTPILTVSLVFPLLIAPSIFSNVYLQIRHHHHFIECILFSPWCSWIIAHLA